MARHGGNGLWLFKFVPLCGWFAAHVATLDVLHVWPQIASVFFGGGDSMKAGRFQGKRGAWETHEPQEASVDQQLPLVTHQWPIGLLPTVVRCQPGWSSTGGIKQLHKKKKSWVPQDHPLEGRGGGVARSEVGQAS